MTPSDRIPVAVMALWFTAWVALLIAVLAADGPDPCEIDAPMEQSQCRANGGRTVVHPVTGWGWGAKE
jgi:hypothetical protein